MKNAVRTLLGSVAIALAIGVGTMSAASATPACTPQLQSFPALIPDIVVGTGGTLTFTQAQALTEFQHVLQSYCSGQNLMQALVTGSAGYSHWSSDEQQLFTSATTQSPNSFATSLAMQVFNEEAQQGQLLLQEQLASQSPQGQTEALQQETAMTGLSVDQLQQLNAMAAQQQMAQVQSSVQGSLDAGQQLDLNGDPTAGWNY